MMRIRKWLVAIPFIFIFVLGLPSLITRRWGWFLADPWDTAFMVLWTLTWIVGIHFYQPGQHQRLPGHIRLTWQKALVESRGDAEAAKVTERAQILFKEQFTNRPHFENRTLQNHLERSILPGLSLYQALLEETGDQNTATSEWKRLFAASLKRNSKFRLVRLLRYVPHPFQLFRWATRQTLQRQFPPAGWAIEWVEDRGQCLAFDIHDCFYLNVLTSLNAPELTGCFCYLDDVLFAALPPSITWERDRTLARGDDRCDFRWSRYTPEMV